ncbi:MAG: ATP-binding cassette domain-containing protein [Acidobacteria bacterium]|nr:ATP-binding cassette domain-containing protein [Acidobacteriota bacterium]
MTKLQKDNEKAAVSVTGLTVARGDRCLFEQMTWSLAKGNFLAVTGPSGVGKSSLLACLQGMITPSDGECHLNVERRSLVGTVFQHLRLTNELSVLTNVLCGRLGNYGWQRTLFGFTTSDRLQAFQIITELGIADLAHKPVKNISGGEQQRTAIARVLFQDPEIILADEPTSDLDPALSLKIMGMLRTLCREGEKTVVAVMHDRELVEEFADVELSLMADRSWAIRNIRTT